MLRQLYVPLLIAGLAGCGGEPVNYTSAEGRFSVLMPGKPMEIGPFIAGGRDTSRSYAVEADEALYTVMFTDLHQAPADPAEFLREEREKQLRQGKATLDRPLSLGGVPGLELRIEHPNGTVAHMRIYLRGARFYQQIAFGYVNEEIARQFFESFALR